MPTIKSLLDNAVSQAETARLDAEILLAHCLQKPRSFLYTWPERKLAEGITADFLALLQQRASGVPVAYLTGHREFWSLDLTVDARTLIPRAETETLVTRALTLSLPYNARVADWGTGSGAIALALQSERPAWYVLASDKSAGALAVAAQNARRHRFPMPMMLSQWGAAFASNSLDLIVSNPPYVAPNDPHLQQGDLRFEPASALVAEQQGLADIYSIAADAGRVLKSGGWLLLEHGYNQATPVQEYLSAMGFVDVESWPDLAGVQRVSGGRLA
ncbi:MAG: peptide chain release factor N(5)-glutamine methyltransferase [Pseudomonadota bacterium]